MKFKVIALAGLLLVGCATHPPVAQTLGDACLGYTNALNKLTPLKAQGKLSSSEIQAVDNANALTKPLCGPGTVPDNQGAAVQFVAGEASAIYAIVQAHGG